MRQVHLDFHTSEKIEDIGKEFSKENFQEALKEGHVDSITVFSKCHHGWAYHPSEANEMHPHLSFDLLKAQIDAAHEIGVKTPVYLSAGFDEKYAVRHPEHILRKSYTEPCEPDFSKAGYHLLCFNTPYTETLLAQVEEVCRNYDLDGLFMDITAPRICYCPCCLALMREQGIDPEDTEAVKRFGEWTYVRYTERVKETAHRVKPWLPIFHNGGHTPRGKRNLEHLNSHIEIESLPTGGWGYDNLPMTARSVQSHGMGYLGMTGKFHLSWGEFGGFKHPNALIYETSLAVANGAASSIGDQLHPLGKADGATYRLIGKAYGRLEALEPWLTNVKARADIALYSYEAYLARHPEEQALDADYKHTDVGALRILLEGHYLFDVVDGENDLSQYQLVILPDGVKVDETLKRQLAPCLANGGKLLASGRSLTDGDSFAYDLGAKYLGTREMQPIYLTPEAPSALDRAGYVLYAPSGKVASEMGGEVLATLREPYFARTAEHFCSHRHAPEDLSSGEAGITVGTDGAYIASEIFREYAKIGSLAAKEFVRMTVERLIGDRKTVSLTNYPAMGIVTVMDQPAEDRSVLHLVYAPRMCKGEKKIEVIEDCPPLYGVSVTFRTDRKVREILLPETGEVLAFTEADGEVSFALPPIGIHTAVAISYL